MRSWASSRERVTATWHAWGLLGAALSVVGAAPGAQAQRAGALGLTGLDAGVRLRVHLADSTTLAGRLVRWSEDTLELRRTVGRSLLAEIHSDTLLATRSIDRVWRYAGNDWQRGAIIGGAAGGLVGLGIGSAVSDFEDAPGATVPVMGLFGVATGALFGALIGRTIDRWTLIGSSRLSVER